MMATNYNDFEKSSGLVIVIISNTKVYSGQAAMKPSKSCDRVTLNSLHKLQKPLMGKNNFTTLHTRARYAGVRK